MANRLIHESSPYLRQHAENPVDWYPWGEEALQRARSEDKPILLSIGYSACHWCHVMEHESFEDEATANLMNDLFVSIKVDREERPDLDQVYMAAVQGMTGRGGWPMTVFLTPDGRPFYGGTYYPPTDRGGMPGFRRVLASVSDAYSNQRQSVATQADRIAEFIRQQMGLRAESSLAPGALDDAADALGAAFDMVNGGFGGAPKFPPAMALEFLLRYHHRTGSPAAIEIVVTTLQKMGTGGIYDQIGGGFHRYSVDAHWLVPHFEKMLYDNALLARTYLHAFQVTGSQFHQRIVEETLDFIRREMQDESGGFFSTQDADSEGVEGKYYVWTPQQIAEVVSADDAAILKRFYGVTDRGNFEGGNILTRPVDATETASTLDISLEHLAEVVARGQEQLLESRSRRVPPARDDKVLSGWNGLMLRTFAEAARVLGRAEDLEVAESNAAFLLDTMWRGGRLFRVYKDGETKVEGYLEDYAAVAEGLLALYQTTFDVDWFIAAQDIVRTMIELFWYEGARSFFDTARDAEALVARPRDLWDNATPSGSSLACHALLTMWALTGEAEYERLARLVLESAADLMRQHPVGFGHLLSALELYLAPPSEIAVIGDPDAEDTAKLIGPLHRQYLPNAVVALGDPADTAAAANIPLLAGRTLVDGHAAAYVCRGFVCDLPTLDPGALLEQIVPRPLSRPAEGS
ncbi:MAG: hypothetical protein HW416_1648 [Chloroflexi bacterium]|nr:hypothetical protein [Chloroflexota bacterium]